MSSTLTGEQSVPTVAPGLSSRSSEPAWLGEARDRAGEPGPHLAYEEDGEVFVEPLTKEWTRVGRSLVADIRFDDPTVSRRHALIVRSAEEVRVLDDRSLNGVFVNSERVEWSPLSDGDRIAVGRHELHFLDAGASGSHAGGAGRVAAGAGA